MKQHYSDLQELKLSKMNLIKINFIIFIFCFKIYRTYRCHLKENCFDISKHLIKTLN